jgi:MFS family permease
VRWRDTFASLRSRNFRLYALAQFAANTGLWMQRIATDWLVLELSGNVALVGLTVAFQYAPMLLLGPLGGVIVDRFPKRVLLIGTQLGTSLLCGTLALLVLLDAAELWQVYGIVAVLGLVAVVDSPGRASFITEMVGRTRLPNAISVNASIFHLGGLVGPAISGLLILFVGSGWPIAINAVASLGVVVALLAMRTRELVPSLPAVRRSGQIREAVRYVRGKPTIFWSIVMVGFIALFGMALPVLLAGMAKTVFEVGSVGYGAFNSAIAIGAVLGAIASTRRRTLRLRTIVFAGVAYGLAQLIPAFAPNAVTFLLLIPAIGFCRLLCVTATESMTQLSSHESIRGRVMSLYVMVLVGGQALCGPMIGLLAHTFGVRTAMIVSGAVPAVAALLIGIWLARSGRLRLRVHLRRRPRIAIESVSGSPFEGG